MPRNELSLSVASSDTDLLELVIHLGWQSWSAMEQVFVGRTELAAFASSVRDFASHQQPEVRFEVGSLDTGRLEILCSEYGRTRKAAFGIRIARGSPTRGTLPWPTTLSIQLPTEHGLLGEFGADLAQLVAADSGTATLRLLRKWPD